MKETSIYTVLSLMVLVKALFSAEDCRRLNPIMQPERPLAQAQFGPMLTEYLRKAASENTSSFQLTADYTPRPIPGEELPVLLQLHASNPQSGETWQQYKTRMQEKLRPVREQLAKYSIESKELITGNALSARCSLKELTPIRNIRELCRVEIDAPLKVVAMDEVAAELAIPEVRLKYKGHYDGKGITVAVVDTGVDLAHPFIQVAESISTYPDNVNPEPVEKCGLHGTHCAGIICSTDNDLAGVAPGVRLLNIKAFDSSGVGTMASVIFGIDAALDMGADLISMSAGFSRLPRLYGGHDWICGKEECHVCQAVRRAMAVENKIVVAAAGNFHVHGEEMRNSGKWGEEYTELICPGQLNDVITVGALEKWTGNVAHFSSCGLSNQGLDKPDVYVPGIDVLSTQPVPRDKAGNPIPKWEKKQLFLKKSGTSMATPFVTGCVALIMQQMKENNIPFTSKEVKKRLFSHTEYIPVTPENNQKRRRIIFSSF